MVIMDDVRYSISYRGTQRPSTFSNSVLVRMPVESRLKLFWRHLEVIEVLIDVKLRIGTVECLHEL